MSLKEQLTKDMKNAMKEHDKERLAVIRMVRGAVRQAEIDGGHKELADDDVIAILSKEVKMRRDSIDEFTKGGRSDLVEKTQAEIDVLMKYLPEQMGEDEIQKLVAETVEQTGASTPKDMGKVMGALMPKLKGRAEGKLVNQIVRACLQS